MARLRYHSLVATIEVIAGLAVAIFTLWDAFETIVLPRTVQRRIRLTRLIAQVTWQPWATLTRLPFGRGSRDTVLAMFGPLLLIFLLLAWAILLICGFGVAFHGLSR